MRRAMQKTGRKAKTITKRLARDANQNIKTSVSDIGKKYKRTYTQGPKKSNSHRLRQTTGIVSVGAAFAGTVAYEFQQAKKNMVDIDTSRTQETLAAYRKLEENPVDVVVSGLDTKDIPITLQESFDMEAMYRVMNDCGFDPSMSNAPVNLSTVQPIKNVKVANGEKVSRTSLDAYTKMAKGAVKYHMAMKRQNLSYPIPRVRTPTEQKAHYANKAPKRLQDRHNEQRPKGPSIDA